MGLSVCLTGLFKENRSWKHVLLLLHQNSHKHVNTLRDPFKTFQNRCLEQTSPAPRKLKTPCFCGIHLPQFMIILYSTPRPDKPTIQHEKRQFPSIGLRYLFTSPFLLFSTTGNHAKPREFRADTVLWADTWCWRTIPESCWTTKKTVGFEQKSFLFSMLPSLFWFQTCKQKNIYIYMNWI